MKRYFVTALLVLAACASQPEEIATAYVSPVHYKNFDCEQLNLEAERVSRRALELHASLKDTADTDEAQMGIGLILFWPALFFLEGGDGAEAMEYARIKGERDAIEERSIEQKCAIEFQKTAAATSGIDQRAGLVTPPAAASEPPIPLAMAQPSVAATSPSSGIAMPPAEYKPLPVGTRIKYDDRTLKVTRTDGFLTVFKTSLRHQVWVRSYAVFGFHGPGVYSISQGGKDLDVDISGDDEKKLESFFPLKVGNRVTFNQTEEGVYDTSVTEWKVTIEVLETDVINVGGYSYATYVIEERVKSDEGPSYVGRKWYHPDSGLIIKVTRKWCGTFPETSYKELHLGPGDEEEYTLVEVKFL